MEKPYSIGIDLGGTYTVFGVVDRRGRIIEKDRFEMKPFEDKSFEDYIGKLKSSLHKLIDSTGGIGSIKGIGMGAQAGNYSSGCVEHAANLPKKWGKVIHFTKILGDEFGIPVSLTNDANAAAIGEMMYGAARGMKNFIVITLGTGVGSGIVSNGQLVYGHDGFAGELGHIIIRHSDGRPCNCGLSGCLETYTSATGVVRTAREFLVSKDDPSVLRDIDPSVLTSKDVAEAAFNGDKLAKEIFDFTGRVLGQAFAIFVSFSSPEAIILFGGLSKAGDLLIKPIREQMEANLLPIFKNKVKLLISELDDGDAAILGASALAWESE